MTWKGTRQYQRKEKVHGNAKWTKEKVEAMLADIRTGMKRGVVAKNHGISQPYMNRKIEEYHAGELR